MNTSRELDRKMLMEMDKEKLIDLLFIHMRNRWAVDGLYFLGIEEKFGNESATEIDAKVWEIMGKIEARRLKEILGIEDDDISTMVEALRTSSWSLDLEEKEIILDKNRALFRNSKCRIQKTRKKKGLEEFPCKKVRWGYLKSFAKEFNQKIAVECNICPPDKHPQKLWCEWEFKL